jgi:hypothetical protein
MQPTDDPFDALDRRARDIQNVVDQCRRAMVNLDVDAKALVVEQSRTDAQTRPRQQKLR